MNRKTGVLVHGCNLNIENWRYVAWGDPPDALGRIPQGLLSAFEFEAEKIIFGTGASKKTFRLGDSDQSGKVLLEAEYSLEYLTVHFDNLRKFSAWQKAVPATHDDQAWSELKASLLNKIELDTVSQNTVEELKHAAKIFDSNGIEQIVLVSSPSHIVRCLRDAATVFATEGKFGKFSNHLFAVPSNTCYEGTRASDVVVIEPPHRPDRHVVPTHRRIQRMLSLQKLNPNDLIQLIEDFDDLLQRYEQRIYNDGSS